MSRRVAGRIERLEERHEATRVAARIVTVTPEDWPLAVQAEWNAARGLGDREQQATVVERMTGERPRFDAGRVGLIVCHRPAGGEV